MPKRFTDTDIWKKKWYRQLPHATERFETLWDSINAKRGYSWDLNPWVWCVDFKRVGNADQA